MEKQTIEYSRRENLLGCVTFDLLKNYRQQSSKLIDIIRLSIGTIALAVKNVDAEILATAVCISPLNCNLTSLVSSYTKNHLIFDSESYE